MVKNDLKDKIILQLEDSKIEEIISIDLSKISSLADLVIIGTGRSGKHIESTMDNLKIMLKNNGFTDIKINGKSTDGWILCDIGNIIIHLFIPEIREVYKLEDFLKYQLKDSVKDKEIKKEKE